MAVQAFGFVLAILPLVITPGFSLMLATQQTLAGQANASLRVALGTGTGIYVHSLLAAGGLVTLLHRWPQALTLLKFIGAAYLFVLGFRMVYGALLKLLKGSAETRRSLTDTSQSVHLQAFGGTVLNAKAAGVYLIVAPQFVEGSLSPMLGMLTLATLHVLLATLWLTCWCMLLSKMRGGRLGSRLFLWSEGLGGVVMIALALRNAIS